MSKKINTYRIFNPKSRNLWLELLITSLVYAASLVYFKTELANNKSVINQ